MRRSMIKTLALTILLCPSGQRARAADNPAELVSVEFVMKGMKAHRQQLVKGKVVISGVKKVDRPLIRNQETDVSILCAFDHESGLLRFDRREAQSTIDSAGKTASDPVTRQSRLWRNSESIAHWREIHQPGEPSLEIHPLSYKPRRTTETLFDIRAVGMLYWLSFFDNSQVEEVLESLMFVPAEPVEERGGQYRLVWELDDHRRTLWVDAKRGFTPTKMIIEDKAGEGWDPEPLLENKTSWRQVDGVWVPEAFMIRMRNKLVERIAEGKLRSAGETSTSYHLAFEWESVNAPLPDNLFSYKKQELPRGTYVVDFRSGEPIIAEVIGADSSLPPSPQSKQESWGLSRFLLVLGSILVLAAVLMALAWRTRQAKG